MSDPYHSQKPAPQSTPKQLSDKERMVEDAKQSVTKVARGILGVFKELKKGPL